MYTKILPRLKEYSINYGKIDNIINNKFNIFKIDFSRIIILGKIMIK